MSKFAFVFPGQGSQSRGMMNGYGDFPVVRDTFVEAGDILKQDLWQLIVEGNDAELNSTVNTQPLMLTAGVAVYRAWQSLNGPAPQMLAGHSLGEYTALVFAGVLDFEAGLRVVQQRGEQELFVVRQFVRRQIEDLQAVVERMVGSRVRHADERNPA